jgi:hypothetical protein
MEQSLQVYLGVPKTSIMQVFRAQQQRVVIKQIIFRNSDEVDTKVTVTINTIDVMTVTIKGGETEMRDTFIVLNPNETLSLQQDKANAATVTICGTSEQASAVY